MHKIFTISLLAACLAACGQGTGTGAVGGTTNGVAAGDQEQVSRMKALQVSKGDAVNITFPAAGVISKALLNLSGTNGIDLQAIQESLVEAAIAGTPIDIQAVIDGDTDRIMKELQSLTPERKSEIQKLGPASLKAMLSAAEKNDSKAVREINERAVYLNMANMSMLPVNGWPLEPEADSKTARYAKQVYMLAEFANSIHTELAAQLATGAWRDPESANQAVLIAWNGMPLEKIRMAWQAAEAAGASSGVNVDMTGARGIHFTIASAGVDVTGDGGGWSVILGGAPWFGKGYLSGRQVNIQLASAISASTTKQSGTSSSTGNNSSVDAGSNSQVK